MMKQNRMFGRVMRVVALMALAWTLSVSAGELPEALKQANDDGSTIGSGDDRIHLIPSLHPYSVKNGETLRVSVLVKSQEPVVSVTADLGGLTRLELQSGSMAETAGLMDGSKVALYEGNWQATDLKERIYPVTLTVTDALGHTVSDTSLTFSDPAAGYSTPGTQDYPNGGLRELDSVAFETTWSGVNCVVIDPAGAYAYFASHHTNGQILKVNLQNFTIAGELILPDGIYILNCGVIDPAGVFGYFGTCTEPGMVVKIDLVNMTMVTLLTMDSGENCLETAAIDPSGAYAYFGTLTTPGRIVKVNLEYFTRTGAIALASGEDNIISSAIDPLGIYAYFGTLTWPGRIVKIDLTSFTRTGSISLATGEDRPSWAVIDPAGDYAYFGAYQEYVFQAMIVKIDLTNFSRVGALVMPEYRPFVTAGIDPTGASGYFSTGSTPCTIVKVNLASFTSVETLTLPESDKSLSCVVIAPSGAHAYYGAGSWPSTEVLKINLANFTRADAIQLGDGEPYVKSAVIDPANEYAYFTCDGVRGKIVKIELESMSRIDGITLAGDEDSLLCAVMDPTGAFAYFGSHSSFPGRIVKIDLANFSQVGALNLADEENRLNSAVIDSNGTFAYFGLDRIPGKIVKIDLSSFSRVGALTLINGENQLQSAVIDPDGTFAYFGTHTTPGRIVKIDLASLTRVGAITLFAGEDSLTSAVIDSNGDYAYFGTDTAPGRIVKIDLTSFSRVEAITLWEGEDSLASAIIDPAGAYACFGTATSLGKVVKIDLASFTRSEVITMPSQHNNLSCAVIDSRGAYAYFGAETSPSRIVKISASQKGFMKGTRLSMTESGEVNELRFYSHAPAGNVRLALYNNNVPKALLWQSNSVVNIADESELIVPISSGLPAQLFLTPGDYWVGWQVDTTEPVPSYTRGTMDVGFYYLMDFGGFPTKLSEADMVPNGEIWTEYITYTPASFGTGVKLSLPTEVHAGDPFYVTGFLHNLEEPIADTAVFFILDIFGHYWFWDDWAYYAPPASSEIDFVVMDVPTGSTPVEVLSAFTWPDTGPEVISGLRFWGAMLNDTYDNVRGEIAMVEWGFGP